jgi:hypothetical protein
LFVDFEYMGNPATQEYVFKDAHGNNLAGVDLFASGSAVSVLLCSDGAYVQNADTNAYLDKKFKLLERDLRLADVKYLPENYAIEISIEGVSAAEDLYDGMEIAFVAPCNSEEVEIIVYCGYGFGFASRKPNLFSKGALVKCCYANGTMFILNADTNTYLEGRFGDIDSALDELHSYAQALIGGEA